MSIQTVYFMLWLITANHKEERREEKKDVFLYWCQSCPLNAIQIVLAAWAIWAVLKKHEIDTRWYLIDFPAVNFQNMIDVQILHQEEHVQANAGKVYKYM